jgi:hypothetical protein
VFSIPEVSFTSIDSKDVHKLSIITRDAQFGLLYCHAFSISDGSAAPIPRTIGVAFQRVTALMQTADRDELKRLGLLVSSRGTSGAIGVFDVKHIATLPTKGTSGNDTVEQALEEVAATTAHDLLLRFALSHSVTLTCFFFHATISSLHFCLLTCALVHSSTLAPALLMALAFFCRPCDWARRANLFFWLCRRTAFALSTGSRTLLPFLSLSSYRAHHARTHARA